MGQLLVIYTDTQRFKNMFLEFVCLKALKAFYQIMIWLYKYLFFKIIHQ